MKVKIRPVKLKDAEDINEMRIMPGVFEYILALPTDRSNRTEDYIASLSGNDYAYVAEIEEEKKVVGFVSMNVSLNPRTRHVGAIGIVVNAEYQGMGIGKKLLENILYIADSYLMLKRIELTVYTHNEKAVGLYKSLGFVVEGCKKYASVCEGRYADEYIMARYKE